MAYTTNPGSGGATFADDLVGAEKHPLVKLSVGTAGSGDLVPGDAANGMDVDVTRLPSIPAGNNNIGDVDVLTLPALPAGTNNIGDVDVLSLPATTNAGATAKTSDYDTGAGTDTVTMLGIALPASGGAVQGGTATNPVRTDPTGTTTQPISGSITNVSGTVSLPTGASTLAEQQAQTTALQLLDDIALTEDEPHVSGDKGVLMLAVRKASTGTLVSLDGDNTPLQTDAAGSLRTVVLNSLTVFSSTTGTTSAATPGVIISAATTNATSIKSSAGNLFFLSASNTNASPRYLKLYNKASAPTVGTDVPVLVFLIPGNTAGAGTNLGINIGGLRFTTGIALALTTGAADTDNTAVALNEIIVNYGFA